MIDNQKTYTRIQYFIEYLTGGILNDSRIYKIDSFDKIPEQPLVESAYAYRLAKRMHTGIFQRYFSVVASAPSGK